MAADGHVTSYAELDRQANQLSHLLRRSGVGVGDHVAFCLGNQPRFLPLVWGAQYAGTYYTALSTRLTAEEAAYIVADCGATVFIAGAAQQAVADALRAEPGAVAHWFADGGSIDGYEPLGPALDAQPATPLDQLVTGRDMLYSSGTTGRPKGVKAPLSGDPIDAATSVTFVSQMLFSYGEEMVYLSPAPLYHAAPLRFTMAVHQVGGTAVVMEKFDPEQFLADIERYQVTHTQVVPTMFIRLLKLPPEVRARYDTSSLQVCSHAAAPCPPAVKQAMIDWWGPIIHEYYAGTEGNGFVYCNSEDWLAHPGTVGKALAGVAHIVDDEGHEVPTGETGTIYFSDGAEFEYHNDPDKTKASRLGNGWSTLGDIGRVDEDGFLFLTDRKAYMIITGGVNVYPQEAENVLALHPRVADVAVFGVPDDEFGEAVKAVVQPADGVTGDDALAAELIAYCRQHLADVKCPRTVDFRDELPRAPTGKLYKRLLRDEYWVGHGGSRIA